jgi:hypothetical protein
VDSSIGGQHRVESLKAEIEEQVEGVLEILSLLFSLLSANQLNLCGVFKVARGS